MSFDWKGIVRTVAPTIGAALGTPMTGAAVKFLADKFLGDPEADEATLADAIASASPEALQTMKAMDQEFKKYMAQLGVDVFKLETADVQNARETNKENKGVYRLGVMILITFALIMGAVLWCAWALLSKGELSIDPGVAAAVFGLVGTVVGYVAANAQQVVTFFFGSSFGSKSKTDAMSDAIRSIGRR